MTMSSQAVARERHISSMSACARHSAAQALPMVMQAVIMALITSTFIPAGRIIMCIVACAISTMFEHIAQHVAISGPREALALAHAQQRRSG
ncbi:hypothetical protein [Microbacterium proteolyticum]|jgi:hypothetical protein|uniref:hypothetical protein n=1 Tax=Microbacterium proteolyticum TaxID=1572644 RepID=UPI001FADC3A3|nr:hypothetical protein [Microbacterium proteolyticum]MCI9859134.1 hypothetical protein [Microbacterium proteolyticum]